MAYFKVDNELVENAEAINKEEAASFSTPSGLYPVVINVAYITESSSSDAVGLTVEYTNGKWKYPKRETMWFQGANGSTTRMAKKRDGSEYPDETFGMKQVRGLCAVTGVEFEAMETEAGKIEVKDGLRDVMVFPDLAGKTVCFGIQETLEDKYGEETTSRSVPNIIWVGRNETDDKGVVFPWGRQSGVDKFQAVIDKDPIKDIRELSKPGASSGKDEAAEAFGGFGS